MKRRTDCWMEPENRRELISAIEYLEVVDISSRANCFDNCDARPARHLKWAAIVFDLWAKCMLSPQSCPSCYGGWMFHCFPRKLSLQAVCDGRAWKVWRQHFTIIRCEAQLCVGYLRLHWKTIWSRRAFSCEWRRTWAMGCVTQCDKCHFSSNRAWSLATKRGKITASTSKLLNQRLKMQGNSGIYSEITTIPRRTKDYSYYEHNAYILYASQTSCHNSC